MLSSAFKQESAASDGWRETAGEANSSDGLKLAKNTSPWLDQSHWKRIRSSITTRNYI